MSTLQFEINHLYLRSNLGILTWSHFLERINI